MEMNVIQGKNDNCSDSAIVVGRDYDEAMDHFLGYCTALSNR